MAETSSAVKKTSKPNLTMEGYLDFIHSEKRLDLSHYQLNQIVHMHGFRKFQGTPKSVLVEIVSKLELMDPSRSTIQDEGVTSDAILSTEDVIKDLNVLKWQECCITSLQTFNAVSHPHDGSIGGGGSSSGGRSAGTVVSASSEKQPRKTRMRKLKKIAGLGASPTNLDIGNFDELPRTQVFENWSPRKKRTPNRGSGAATPVSAG